MKLVLPCILCVLSVNAYAIDTVYRKSDGKEVGGEITSVTKTEVVVTQKVGNREEKIAANDIIKVEWDGEPPALRLARSNESSGNLQEALTGLTEAKNNAEGSDLKAEIDFLLARTAAKIGRKDQTQLSTAIDALKSFVSDNRDHFRFYDAQLLLADTALLAGDTVASAAAYSIVEQAPWEDYKMAGQIGNANSLLAQDDVNGAKSIFDKVAGMNASSPAESARKLEAMLGQASCEQRSTKYEEATKTLKQVVEMTTADDTRLLAEAYLQLGECYAVDATKSKDAILAYLHVDVVPSLAKHGDLHAQALYHLAKLWPAAGQPARGAEASAKLETDYPNSEWTKKLGSGS